MAVVNGGDSGHRQRQWQGARVTRAGLDEGTRASARPVRVRRHEGMRARGHEGTRAQRQEQGQGWINIDNNISCSRSGARGVRYNDNVDNDAINAGGVVEIPKR